MRPFFEGQGGKDAPNIQLTFRPSPGTLSALIKDRTFQLLFRQPPLQSLYDGSPGQFKPFTTRYRTKSLTRNEQLFLAKYVAVNGEYWTEQVRVSRSLKAPLCRTCPCCTPETTRPIVFDGHSIQINWGLLISPNVDLYFNLTFSFRFLLSDGGYHG